MFGAALRYATREPEGGRAILVGGALSVLVGGLVALGGLGGVFVVFPLLAVVPWLCLRGYYVRVLRYTPGHDRPVPPRFDRFGRLLADGLKAIVIAGAYLLPAAVVLAPVGYARTLAGGPGGLLSASLPGAAASAALSVVGAAVIFAIMYLIGALYAIPVAVTRFAYTERFGAAFEFRRVAAGATSEDYVVAWVVTVLLQGVVLPVAYLLRVLLVGFFAGFVVLVGVRYCYGQGVGAALELEPREAPTRESPDPAFVPVDDAAARGAWDPESPADADGDPGRDR